MSIRVELQTVIEDNKIYCFDIIFEHRSWIKRWFRRKKYIGFKITDEINIITQLEQHRTMQDAWVAYRGIEHLVTKDINEKKEKYKHEEN